MYTEVHVDWMPAISALQRLLLCLSSIEGINFSCNVLKVCRKTNWQTEQSFYSFTPTQALGDNTSARKFLCYQTG